MKAMPRVRDGVCGRVWPLSRDRQQRLFSLTAEQKARAGCERLFELLSRYPTKRKRGRRHG